MGLEAINQCIHIWLEKAADLRRQLRTLPPSSAAESDLRQLRFIGTRKHHQPLSLPSSLIQGYSGSSRAAFPAPFSWALPVPKAAGGDRHGSWAPNRARTVLRVPLCPAHLSRALLASPNPEQQQLLSSWSLAGGVPAPSSVPVIPAHPAGMPLAFPTQSSSWNSKPCLAGPACAHLQKILKRKKIHELKQNICRNNGCPEQNESVLKRVIFLCF